MAADDLTSTDAVEAVLLRSLRPNESDHIGELIAQVSDRLRDKRGDVDDLIAKWALTPRPAEAISPKKVASVLAEVLARRLNNPKGLWSTSESSAEGPYSSTVSETYPGARGGDSVGSVGGLTITAADMREIFGSRGRRAGTIHVSIGMR